MTDKELKRLKRVDLLELLIAQTRENDRLKKDLDEALARLEERDLVLEEAGSIAEAALRVNKVYQVAQAAVDQYIVSIQRLGAQRRASWEKMEQETLEKCRRMERETQKKCEAMLAEAQKGQRPK